MNAVRDWRRPEPLSATSLTAVDQAVAELRAHADQWVATGIEGRIKLLRAVLLNLETEVDAWVATSCRVKGIEPGSNAEGQEWVSGFLGIPRSVRYFMHTLEHDGSPPAVSQRRRSTPKGDQWIVRVFPESLLDKSMFHPVNSALSSMVWGNTRTIHWSPPGVVRRRCETGGGLPSCSSVWMK